MTANFISASRMLFSVILLFLPPFHFSFILLYILCGATDVLDGFVARKLHTVSAKGAALDSTADLLFTLVYAVKVLPNLSIPLWIWGWTLLIALVKATGILIASKNAHGLYIEHSFANKFTGLLLFLLPLSVCITDIKYSAAFVCIAASATTIYRNDHGLQHTDGIL